MPPGSPGGPQATSNPFVSAGPGFRRGRGLQIEIDIVGDEEIQMAVAVIIDEMCSRCSSGSSGPGWIRPGFLRYIGERAVAIIAVERVLAVVSDEQIVVAVVVVIADAASLSPAGAMLQAGAFGNIGECAVAIVLEQMAARLLPAGKPSRRQPLTRKISSQPSLS